MTRYESIEQDVQLQDAAKRLLHDHPGRYRIVVTLEIEAPNLAEAVAPFGPLAAHIDDAGFDNVDAELFLDDERLGSIKTKAVRAAE